MRRHGDLPIGYVPVRTQLTWCAKEGVLRAVIIHCGSEIDAGDERKLGARLRAMARQRGVQAEFAHDGLAIVGRVEWLGCDRFLYY